ncbi:MAG: hypothetical protein ACFFB2_05065 [Promethearchaeota archaeon]
MLLIKKKLNELDITWKIAFRKTILVLVFYIGATIVSIIIFIGLIIIATALNPIFPLGNLFNETTLRLIINSIALFASLIGFFKALIDILILTKADFPPS